MMGLRVNVKKMKWVSIVAAYGAMLGTFAVSHAAPTELAKVNGRSITDKDLRNALSGLNEGQRDSVLKDPNSRREILNRLIEQEVLVGEAVKEKVDQEQDFKDALEAFRKQFLANRVLQKNLGTKMTETATKKYYEANKKKFSTDQVHVQHILLPTEESAKEMLVKARAPDADFQGLAEKHSKDPSAKNNRGDLGFQGRDRFVPEFTEAAFGGSKGDIVGPVKTSYGYHIIKVIDKKLGKPLEFGEVELRVKNEMGQELRQTYVGNLRKQAKIEVNDKALEKM